jgi:hypothetical protein
MNNRLKYPKRYPKVKSRNEVEELREENRQLRELVAKLSKLAVERFSEGGAESGESSGNDES